MAEAYARYKLHHRIAIGGTAEVFRATFLSSEGVERPIVIKRILPQFARDERFRQIFHEEACVAVTITHHNIVRILDHGDIGQTCYIAMELVEGKDLGSLLASSRSAGTPPPFRVSAFIVAQVCDALQFIHNLTSSEGTPLRIIHRDVSPQNILVSYDGDVKLTDFGIAKSAIRQELTVDGVIRGKIEFMAPEQATLSDVDYRSDIFALGCVLYKMVQGSPPFRGSNELETLDKVRLGRMTTPPEELSAPASLLRVIQRALQHAREDRYQDAAEMAIDLRAFLAEEGNSCSSQELGGWVSEMEARPARSASNSVDQAVKHLLGEEGMDDVARSSGTAVFASSTATLTAEPTAETAPPTLREAFRFGRFKVAVLAVAILGMSGWLLWGLDVMQARTAAVTDTLSGSRDSSLSAPEQRSASDGSTPAQAVTTFSTTPAGATVFINGRKRGLTPLKVSLPAGAFWMKIEKKGYHPVEKMISQDRALLGIDQQLKAVVHSRGVGRLTINSLPWSKVRLDGRVIGNTPLIKTSVKAGRHRVELLSPSGEVRKRFIANIPRAGHRSYTFDLTK